MTLDSIDLDFLPLRVTHVAPNGKRSFDPDSKRRLVEMCLQSGASLSGLALKAGVNANQLRKWVEMYRKASTSPALPKPTEAEASAFVPVVTIENGMLETIETAPESLPMCRETPPAPTVAQPRARLSVRLPSGITVDLECTSQDASLVKAMIVALGVG
ncbi:transposase family protein [Burkholderia pseudomallei]|uniref:IS66-like element accessory protein TnpA n=1 Tax=Burkholderia pseudomallei TaxID=28450 RepID=UPI00050F0329|nr:transposase [Burkholderia pseudomallei]KGC70083.1 transposase family protein [Burkholderia pseudomallei]